MSFLQKPSQTWQKFRDFIASPSHSRTMGILVMLVLVSAVSLTVVLSQQQQTLKQRASTSCTVKNCNGNVCNAGQVCAPGISTSTDPYYSNCYCSAAIGPAAPTLTGCVVISQSRVEEPCVTKLFDSSCKMQSLSPQYTGDECARTFNQICVETRNNDLGKTWFARRCNSPSASLSTSGTSCDSDGDSCTDDVYDDNDDCTHSVPSSKIGTGCVDNGFNTGICTSNGCDTTTPNVPSATPAPPASSFNCVDKDCYASQTCVGSSYSTSTYCLQKGAGAITSYCGTPNKTPNNDACTSGYCNSDLRCAASANPPPAAPVCTDTSCNNVDCTKNTPPQTCNTATCSCVTVPTVPAGDQSGCAPILADCGPPSCCSPYNGQPVVCCAARNYTCRVAESCPVAPPPAPPPAVTVPPVATVNNVTLVLTLNVQDMPATENNLSANLILYSLATNSKVAGAPAMQSFAKTPIPGKQYSANVPLTNLPQDRYFIIARKDNMIAKSVFTVSSATGNITVPTTTLVFGDVDNNNDINILDYNILKDCWRKKTATGSCASSDFDKSGGAVDQIDYNTWMKGAATWNKEGQNL